MANTIGPRGETGLRGDAGPRGDTGDIGPKGDAGQQGEQGVGVEELIQVALDLGEQVAALQSKLGVGEAVEALDKRTDKVELLTAKISKWTKLVAAGLILDLVLSFGLGGVALTAKNASNKGSKAVKTTVAVEQELCLATQRSWDTRKSLAEILTKPTVLSPEVEKLFPPAQVESLRLQIASANKLRKAQRQELLSSNGPRPACNISKGE